MPEIKPFVGIHYSRAYLSGDVLAPPFDVVSEEQRAEFAARSPYNIVALDKGPAGHGPEWYGQAAALKERWLAEGVLVYDERPAFYGYRQTFRVSDHTYTRTGFMAAVRLSPWGQGIHPHERTRKADIADRLQLTRAMRANLSPVFGLYQDTDGQIAQLLTPESPLLKDVHVDGVQHTFWRIGDGERVGALGALLADRDIVIADGHHRYETALAYQAECRATARGSVPPGPHDYVLMYLTDALSPDLVILPTHRIVKRESVDQEQLLHALASEFDLYSLGDSSDLAAALGGYADGRVAMAMLTRDMGAFVLRLKTRPALPQRPGSEHALLRDLDVAVLQDRVLAPLLGISRETLAASGAVTYTIDAQVAAQAVREGGAQLAFILNPTSMDQVWNAATAGLAMPQKSTYFYPKLLTGLVINPLTCDK